MREGAKILSCAAQDENICIWAELDTRNGYERRIFTVYDTGLALPEDMSKYVFIGTCLFDEAAFTFHVYEVIK